jgi:hypothetical protein
VFNENKDLSVMRYVYVVTRIVEGETVGTPIPNLGVHKTFKKAKSHFEAIIKSRIRDGHKALWGGNYNTLLEDWDRYVVVNTAHILEGNVTEELRLEKWRV